MTNRKQTIKDLTALNVAYLFGVGMGSRWEMRTVLASLLGMVTVILISVFIDYLIIVFKQKDND